MYIMHTSSCLPKTKIRIYLFLVSCWKWKSLIHSEKDGWCFVTEKFPLWNICWEMKEGSISSVCHKANKKTSVLSDVATTTRRNHDGRHGQSSLGGVSVMTELVRWCFCHDRARSVVFLAWQSSLGVLLSRTELVRGYFCHGQSLLGVLLSRTELIRGYFCHGQSSLRGISVHGQSSLGGKILSPTKLGSFTTE